MGLGTNFPNGDLATAAMYDRFITLVLFVSDKLKRVLIMRRKVVWSCGRRSNEFGRGTEERGVRRQ